MPAEATAIMRKAFRDALKSKAYAAESQKLFEHTSIAMPIAVGEQKMDKIANFDPKMTAFLKDFITRGEASRAPGKRRKRGKRRK